MVPLVEIDRRGRSSWLLPPLLDSKLRWLRQQEPTRLARVAFAARQMMMGHLQIIPNMATGDLDVPRWPSTFGLLGQLG